LPDMFTRLMLSLVATGIAPVSFYELDADGNRQRAHYDGLPVEFIAESISTLGAQVVDGFETYHVMNPHDDGIGLDEYVDWLIEADLPLGRVAGDYAAWLRRFETAVRALPEPQRQASLLPLLHNYQRPETPIRGSTAPTDRFRSAVQKAEIGAYKDIPHVTREVIVKYNTDLRLLYQATDLFVYPSKGEGFGIPPLEAGAMGIPTICSNTTAMEEFSFFGDRHIHPDVAQLKASITRALTEQPSNLREISNTIRRRYGWEKAAFTMNELIWNKVGKPRHIFNIPGTPAKAAPVLD